MNALTAVLLLIAVAAAIVFLLRAGARAFQSGDHSEKELLRLCRGDRQMMDRLIEHEIAKGRNKTRQAAIRAAIYSVKRDNR